MKNKKKKVVLSILLCLTILFSPTSLITVTANTESNTSKDDFYIDGNDLKIAAELTSDETDNIDLNIEDNSEEIEKPNSRSGYLTLPSKYNALDNRYVTSVKDQKNLGLCWDFSVCSALETSVLKKSLFPSNTDIDISEKHLGWFKTNGNTNTISDKSLYGGDDTFLQNTKFDKDDENRYYVGGSFWDAATVLMRGYGAVNESAPELEYNIVSGKFANGYDVPEEYRMHSDIRVDNLRYLHVPYYDQSESTFLGNLNGIKEAVYSESGVGISYTSSDTIYNKKLIITDSDTGKSETVVARYFNGLTKDGNAINKRGGHAVHIVGWDDTFKASNFSNVCGRAPEGDGAWICKNSWGENSTKTVGGYFYLSYYDRSIRHYFSIEAEEAQFNSDGNTVHEYKNIYQYDGVMFGDAQLYSTVKYDVYKGANYFTARSDEVLSALVVPSFRIFSTLEYSIYKIDDSDYDNPEPNGGLLTKGSFNYDTSGVCTIPIDPVYLSKGTTFSVVFSIKRSNEYIVPMEASKGQNVSIDVTENVSYMYHNGSWEKMDGTQTFDRSENVNGTMQTVTYTLGNAYIKALTNPCFLLGDVNLDGRLTQDDYTLLENYVSESIKFVDAQLKRADFNNDGKIAEDDVSLLTQYIKENTAIVNNKKYFVGDKIKITTAYWCVQNKVKSFDGTFTCTNSGTGDSTGFSIESIEFVNHSDMKYSYNISENGTISFSATSKDGYYSNQKIPLATIIIIITQGGRYFATTKMNNVVDPSGSTLSVNAYTSFVDGVTLIS